MTQTEHDIDAWLHSLPHTEESQRLVTEWLQSPDASEDEETLHSEDQTQENTGSTVPSLTATSDARSKHGGFHFGEGDSDLGVQRCCKY